MDVEEKYAGSKILNFLDILEGISENLTSLRGGDAPVSPIQVRGQKTRDPEATSIQLARAFEIVEEVLPSPITPRLPPRRLDRWPAEKPKLPKLADSEGQSLGNESRNSIESKDGRRSSKEDDAQSSKTMNGRDVSEAKKERSSSQKKGSDISRDRRKEGKDKKKRDSTKETVSEKSSNRKRPSPQGLRDSADVRDAMQRDAGSFSPADRVETFPGKRAKSTHGRRSRNDESDGPQRGTPSSKSGRESMGTSNNMEKSPDSKGVDSDLYPRKSLIVDDLDIIPKRKAGSREPPNPKHLERDIPRKLESKSSARDTTRKPESRLSNRDFSRNSESKSSDREIPRRSKSKSTDREIPRRSEPKSRDREIPRRSEPKSSDREIPRKSEPKSSDREIPRKLEPKSSDREIPRKSESKSSEKDIQRKAASDSFGERRPRESDRERGRDRDRSRDRNRSPTRRERPRSRLPGRSEKERDLAGDTEKFHSSRSRSESLKNEKTLSSAGKDRSGTSDIHRSADDKRKARRDSSPRERDHPHKKADSSEGNEKKTARDSPSRKKKAAPSEPGRSGTRLDGGSDTPKKDGKGSSRGATERESEKGTDSQASQKAQPTSSSKKPRKPLLPASTYDKQFRYFKSKVEKAIDEGKQADLFQEYAKQSVLSCFLTGIATENEGKKDLRKDIKDNREKAMEYYRYLSAKLAPKILTGMANFDLDEKTKLYQAMKAKALLRERALTFAFNSRTGNQVKALLGKLTTQVEESKSVEPSERKLEFDIGEYLAISLFLVLDLWDIQAADLDFFVDFYCRLANSEEGRQLKMFLELFIETMVNLETVMGRDQEAGSECKVS
ncbi:hypothetical protein NDN08_002643 [Rhodosorus marinus]|uniref:Ribosome assembly protein 3 n=1 Tax=Rhodosorus marinus TaxID=101924 RepID=A0AAV8UWZ6_9RHOD|nr:hypothetical protein NDN08_002643 [Rhodosorus marinus]